MPFLNGTASDHVDLLLRLRNFVLTVGWEELYWNGSILDIKGTGDNGNDEVYLRIGLSVNSVSNIYNLYIYGASGYDAKNTRLINHSLGQVFMAMWPNAMPFTFIADGRRIIVVASVVGSMYCFHAGLLRPIATDEQEPYPLFVAGTHTASLSYTDNSHLSPWQVAVGGMAVWAPDGTLLHAPLGTIAYAYPNVHPWNDDKWDPLGEVFGGGYVLRPSLVYTYRRGDPANYQYQTAGHIDGIFYVTAVNMVAGSTIIIGGDTYLLCSSGSNIEENDYAAIRLT